MTFLGQATLEQLAQLHRLTGSRKADNILGGEWDHINHFLDAEPPAALYMAYTTITSMEGLIEWFNWRRR